MALLRLKFRSMLKNSFAVAFAFAVVSQTIAIEYITDSDDSALVIAQAIANSSGGAPEDYLEYGRKLAKTLSYLSPEQQQQVFNGNSGSAETSSNQNNSSGNSSDTLESPSNGSSTTDPTPTSQPWWQPIADVVTWVVDKLL